jgi:uncharacterized protein (DUF1015 family)
MARIHPFKAVRPTRDKAQLVSTRPLAAYRKHVLRAKLDENPYTFLHIIHPEVDRQQLAKASSEERFEAVKQRYEQFNAQGIFIQDAEPTCYVYRQTKNGHEFTGVIAGASIDEYQKDTIKKHEATLTSRETMFTNYLNITGFNAEPVLLAHESSAILDVILAEITSDRAEYEFSTTDCIKHELWVVQPKHLKLLVDAFEPMEELYIADGHHRSASSSRLKDHLYATNCAKGDNCNYFLAYLIDEKRLEIIEFNRIVKHLNGLSEENFVDKLKEHFNVIELPKARKPKKEHEIVVLLNYRALLLTPKDEVLTSKDVVKQLDAQILTDFILEPILGIEDLKTSKDIEFVPGTIDLKQLKDKLHKDDAAVAFLLYPVPMSAVKAVADQGKIMPPKSTWVEPKMRSGLTIYNINE